MLNGLLGYRFFWFLNTVTGSLNPDTGDRNAVIMKYIIALLIISAVVIVGYLLWSSSKKKKGKK